MALLEPRWRSHKKQGLLIAIAAAADACPELQSLQQTPHHALDVQPLQVNIGLTAADEHDGSGGYVHHGYHCSNLQMHLML